MPERFLMLPEQVSFNKAQRGIGKGTCSNGSACNWLQKHRPKVAICPHKQDYCDTCAKHNTDIHTQQTTLNQIRQSGSASVKDQLSIEAEIKCLGDSLEEHHMRARLSHEHYIEQSAVKSQWRRSEKWMMKKGLPCNTWLTLTLSADYQMTKLVPHWGFSPQPGSTYYFHKLSHDILGIVNHSDKTSCIYIFRWAHRPEKHRPYCFVHHQLSMWQRNHANVRKETSPVLR